MKELKREDVLERVVKVETKSSRVRAVFKYDKRLPNLSAIFTRNWQTMTDDDQRLKEVFPEPPMVCFRRGKNVRETLCQAKLPPPRMRRQDIKRRRGGSQEETPGVLVVGIIKVY